MTRLKFQFIKWKIPGLVSEGMKAWPISAFSSKGGEVVTTILGSEMKLLKATLGSVKITITI